MFSAFNEFCLYRTHYFYKKSASNVYCTVDALENVLGFAMFNFFYIEVALR